jgi:hypothetical protein
MFTILRNCSTAQRKSVLESGIQYEDQVILDSLGFVGGGPSSVAVSGSAKLMPNKEKYMSVHTKMQRKHATEAKKWKKLDEAFKKKTDVLPDAVRKEHLLNEPTNNFFDIVKAAKNAAKAQKDSEEFWDNRYDLSNMRVGPGGAVIFGAEGDDKAIDEDREEGREEGISNPFNSLPHAGHLNEIFQDDLMQRMKSAPRGIEIRKRESSRSIPAHRKSTVSLVPVHSLTGRVNRLTMTMTKARPSFLARREEEHLMAVSPSLEVQAWIGGPKLGMLDVSGIDQTQLDSMVDVGDLHTFSTDSFESGGGKKRTLSYSTMNRGRPKGRNPVLNFSAKERTTSKGILTATTSVDPNGRWRKKSVVESLDRAHNRERVQAGLPRRTKTSEGGRRPRTSPMQYHTGYNREPLSTYNHFPDERDSRMGEHIP